MELEGTVQNGVVVFDSAEPPPDGTKVTVTTKSGDSAGTEPDTVGGRLAWLVGAAKDLPPDFAEEHNHYIHGTPRRRPREDYGQ